MAPPTAPPRRAPTSAHPPDARAAQRRREAEERALRRSFALLGMTLLAPGSAQVAVGNRRLGRCALWSWLALLLVSALVWFLVPRTTLLGLAVRPFVLGSFTVLVWAIGIAWALLLVDAWRLGDPLRLRRGHRPVVVVTTLVLCLAVVAPFAYAARFAGLQRDLVVSLFPDGRAAAASGGRINVLLLGADTGDDRVGTRTDSIHLLSADVSTGRSVLFSLPRNLQKVPFADGSPLRAEFPRGFRGEGNQSEWLLNAVYTYAEERPELYPGAVDPGAEAVRDAVSGALGLDVHYYAMVDMAGFEGLVDALGGVSLNVAEPVEIPDGSLTIQPGVQRMDGVTALWYSRSRTGSDDYARMARQRCVIGAVAREADPGTVVRNFQEIAATTKGTVSTDVPQEALPQLLDLAVRGKALDLTTVQFVPPVVVPATPDFDRIRDTVREALAASRAADQAADPAGEADGPAVAAPTGGTVAGPAAAGAEPADPADPADPTGAEVADSEADGDPAADCLVPG